MSYFPTLEELAAEAERWDNLSPEEKLKEIVLDNSREQARQKENEKAEEEAIRHRQQAVADVKSRAKLFREMINKAHDDRDTVRYAYGVAVLAIINNLELGIKEIPTDDIRSVIPESVPSDIGLNEIDYLNRICPRFGGNKHIDLALHENINLSNYTLRDLVGCLVRRLNNPTNDDFDLFKYF